MRRAYAMPPALSSVDVSPGSLCDRSGRETPTEWQRDSYGVTEAGRLLQGDRVALGSLGPIIVDELLAFGLNLVNSLLRRNLVIDQG